MQNRQQDLTITFMAVRRGNSNYYDVSSNDGCPYAVVETSEQEVIEFGKALCNAYAAGYQISDIAYYNMQQPFAGRQQGTELVFEGFAPGQEFLRIAAPPLQGWVYPIACMTRDSLLKAFEKGHRAKVMAESLVPH